MLDNFDVDEDVAERPPDPRQEEARNYLRDFFEKNKEQVFFSKQLEVRNEGRYFHWITYRAIRELEAEGLLNGEWRKLPGASSIRLLWHKSLRYYKREANRVAKVVEEYANPNIGASVGLHGEMMTLEAFARSGFIWRGRDVRSYGGKTWDDTEHNLDFIFERDGIAYGIEVKNTLGYMDKKEFDVKVKLCKYLGIRPVFVVRMIPKSWMFELYNAGGFGLIFKYQLYPYSHRELAVRVANELGLPLDSPRVIEEGTMARFLRFHKKLIVN